MAEDGAMLKGLRLLTVVRGREGYGFHMYTNKTLKGQYIKWVSPNGPADLAGMLPGDHVLEVDGTHVETESHQTVVELIRGGSATEKKILVIDQKTEKEMRSLGEEVNASNAVMMIPRTLSSPSGSYPSVPAPVRSPTKSIGSDETDGPSSPIRYSHGSMPGSGQGVGGAVSSSYKAVAKKSGKKSERVKVKQSRDWRSSIEAYNNL
ncbi:Na(+)/H(+) exchange regulatory cofactor NHE-RF1-like [Halichondria panicea]|uniref:Na(+)/H(+) exchange regulatory cofactor NHE-RF1-like n=1 Tax=Halichondria panicea TaxID=6063 RepID=UPI00312B9A29